MIGARTVEEVRGDFPILGRRIDGKALAYLDNAATAQKPRQVLDAIRTYYEHGNANVHRALHTLGEEATAAFEAARGKVRRFLNAGKASEIIFTRGTTEAINLVASAWAGQELREGDVVLLTEMEHHSNLVPWQLVCERRGCRLAFIPVEPNGTLDLDKAVRTWDPRTRLVAVTQVSNVLGTINDVKSIAALAHERDALVLVDGAQSVPHFAVDVRDLDCDFFAFSGHKAYGPMGIGALYGKERLLEAMPPWMGGGEMIRAVWLDHSTWNELPWKFEAGTPNVEGAVGLGAAIDYLQGLGLPAVAAWEEELARHALARLCAAPGIVPVETEYDLVCLAHEFLHMQGSRRGAKGSDRIFDACLRQRHHIHVPFDHYDPAGIADRGSAGRRASSVTRRLMIVGRALRFVRDRSEARSRSQGITDIPGVLAARPPHACCKDSRPAASFPVPPLSCSRLPRRPGAACTRPGKCLARAWPCCAGQVSVP